MLPDGRTGRSVLGVAAVVGLAATFLAAVIYVSITNEIVFGIFTGDSGRAVVDDWYAGLLSDVGVLTWALGAVASLVTALILVRRHDGGAVFFMAMGLITAWLAADDAFLWHEEFIPDTFGIGERAVFAAYGLATLITIAAGRRTIARNLWWVFAAGCVLLAGSLVVDRLGLPVAEPGDTVSGLKFMGIATWAAFFLEAAIHAIHTTRRPAPVAIGTGAAAWPPPRAGDAIGR